MSENPQQHPSDADTDLAHRAMVPGGHHQGPHDHPELAIYGVGPIPAPRTLVDIIRQTIKDHPNSTAIQGLDGSLTYGELEAHIQKHVIRLNEAGIGRGDRVGIRVPSGTTDLYVAILATLFAGAAYVPVDWDDPDSRANTVWEEAQVAAVFCKDLDIQRMDVDSAGRGFAEPTIEDDAWIIFTSGSTGKPKGVAITHRSAAALVDVEADLYLNGRSLGPQDRVMAGLSVAFDASCEEMWMAWRSGANLVTAPRDIVRSGEDLGKWIVEQQITAVSTVPTLASLWPVESLSKVRLLIFGGEACPLDLAAKFDTPDREVWNTYGPTEATVIATGALLSSEPPVRIGRPIDGWELVVVDSSGTPVKWGETGELIIGGVGLGRYLDKDKDAEKYAPLKSLGWERAYRTGDLVKAEREGLIFAGRTDDQIKIGGKRLELGEVDDHLCAMPNVRVGAAAMHKTNSGTSVLVGYLVAEDSKTIDLNEVRPLLGKRLPGGVVPSLCILDEMPMKTSGKVDRKALPWPLPSASDDEESNVPEDLQWLADLWLDQLGPVPLDEDSDFFSLGGGSVAVARLVAALREHYPSVEIAQVYGHPTLREMADYAYSLKSDDVEKPMPKPIPKTAAAIQAATIAGLYALNALRYVIGSLAVVWALHFFFDAGWVVRPPLLPLLAAWLVLFSIPGRVLTTAAIVRMLNWNIRPGEYLRGGGTHMRLWVAQRLLEHQKLDNLYGSPMAVRLHRLFGNKIGEHVKLGQAPSVTGLVSIGDDVSVEHEADLNGYWIDGDKVIVGTITIDKGARIGQRVLVSPNAHVRENSEIMPGSHVQGTVPANEVWGGSPLRKLGPADLTWPEEDPSETQEVKQWSSFTNTVAHQLALLWVTALPILALLPGMILVMPRVIFNQWYEQVFPVLAMWTPLFVLMTMATWLALVIVTVRLASMAIKPGYFPAQSITGVCVYLTQVLMQRTLISTYVIYASFFTPTFMRMLGAKVGRNVEISTVETIPHLSVFEDGSFMADHSLVASTRYKKGWLHIGSSVVGEKSFVGNSAIVGPDRDLPPDSLVAVLSSLPAMAPASTSWLGRSAESIPRQRVDADSEATYQPPMHLQIARVCVELCRLIPAIISAYLDLFIVWLLTDIYVTNGMGIQGLQQVFLWAWPVVMGAGLIAALLPVLVKWVLIGRFKATNKPLFSSFVWRGELADAFAESLAVPSLIRMSIGSPFFNIWARMMGTKIGKNVWCETWWLPEFDLIELDDNVTINRGTVVQTHLFHDRVMSMEKVHFAPGSTLGPNSFVLPGATIMDRTTIGPGSLVMRQEVIPKDSLWAGNPVRHIEQVGQDDNAIAFAKLIADSPSTPVGADGITRTVLTKPARPLRKEEN